MQVYKAAKYIRLSYTDDKSNESNSVGNQRKLIEDFVSRHPEIELVSEKVDDGYSGVIFDRPAFKEMMDDIMEGKINCVIVKNLSRAFRNSANQGHFLEEFIPLYNTRFISLYQPRIDTFLDPEVVHSLEVSITGFMNEQYAYKTSADVRRTFKHKRENGEFIGAFAPYGYVKDPEDKNSLIIDEEAAQVVRDIFSWFITEGLSKNGIAKRLNEYGILNPAAYKRSKGFHYENPHCKYNYGMWSPSTVARILQNPLYIGVMRQGRQKVISYKVHKRTSVPEDEWYIVENAVPVIIEKEMFQAAQNLHKRDTRTAPGKREVYLFSGFIRCADCGKSMVRHTSRNLVYYQCRTYQDKSRDKCAKYSIRLDILEKAVLAAVQKQIELVDSLAEMIDEINRAPVVHTESLRLNALLEQRTRELEKVTKVLDDLYMDWKSGDITRDQYRRMKVRFEEQSQQLQETIAHIQVECEILAQGIDTENPYLTAFLKHRNIDSLSRGLLVELVNAIYVHEDKSIEIEFNYADQYRRIAEYIENNQKKLCETGGKAV